jgi:carboxynorspermidine decarboxylase
MKGLMMPQLHTPYYLIDEIRLKKNLEIIEMIRKESGAKSVLALKCFSTWCVFDLMRQYLDGTTSSSLFEAKLGREKFGKEVHAYSVVYSAEEIEEIRTFADKVIFNSVSQLQLFHDRVRDLKIGLRVNPGISYSHFDLADPARRYSRLGVCDEVELQTVSDLINGIMFHFNCENDDVENLASALELIGEKYGATLAKMEWVSLGGGIYFTKEGYPLERFCEILKEFSSRHGVQLYLEPGEAAITCSAELVTTVLDVVHNEVDIAIVDASVEAHLLDHLIYATSPRVACPVSGDHPIMIAGRTCLAGDIFGSYHLDHELKVGDEVRFADMAGYTMVKKNWFNGVPMPSIAVRRLNGEVELVRSFSFDDYLSSLS